MTETWSRTMAFYEVLKTRFEDEASDENTLRASVADLDRYLLKLHWVSDRNETRDSVVFLLHVRAGLLREIYESASGASKRGDLDLAISATEQALNLDDMPSAVGAYLESHGRDLRFDRYYSMVFLCTSNGLRGYDGEVKRWLGLV